MTALLSSRLVFILAVVISVYLISRENDFRGMRLSTAIAVAIMSFAATTQLNYLRNANYYEAQGISNRWLMNVAEILAYLGTPAQASFGIANAMGNGSLPHPWSGVSDPTHLLVPTYFTSSGGGGGGIRYAGLVDVAPNLTTNSIFADVGSQSGLAGLVLVLVVMFFAAILTGHLSLYQNYVALAAGALIYAFAEVWRVYLFNAGILHALVLATLVAAIPVFTGAPRHPPARNVSAN
ncbi:hypothetical protein [Blastococcus sp. PRF04-17]|uniref:hypothetical protein n=1 Tax=Blastococcus sp. PRF04-17 TaxID=2933797 RepID=UPI001FF68FEE|nr:hypothetical protein [Blastococcus sp. PRF04-17]UOY00220.1 hypothetical protein MVA48_14545 [Blastococcus sp. PRF04-17]